jgi:hypothetical protein
MPCTTIPVIAPMKIRKKQRMTCQQRYSCESKMFYKKNYFKYGRRVLL